MPAGGGRIVGEIRAEDRSGVGFFCLREQTGEICWKCGDFGLGWWCGIEGESSSVVYLHGFASPDLPVHRGVHAVDIESGRMLWSAPDLRFISADSGALHASEDSGGIVELDPRTGQRRRSGVRGEEAGEQTTRDDGWGGSPIFPVPLAAAEPAYPGLGALIQKAFPALSAEAEVIVDGALVIVGTTAGREEGPTPGISGSVVLVLRRADGAVLFREDLRGSGGMHVPDSFFVRDGVLVYVRERTILTGVRLSQVQIEEEGKAR